MPRRPRLVLLLYRAQRALWGRVERDAVEAVGVTAAQLGPLFFIAKNPGCTQGAVGREVGIHKAGTSKLIARMERAGLVERRASADDGRALALQATGKGAAAVDRAMPLVRRVNRELTEGFSADEIDVVARFLTRVIERFEDHS